MPLGAKISWDQRIIDLITPEIIKSVNVQDEIFFQNLPGYFADILFIEAIIHIRVCSAIPCTLQCVLSQTIQSCGAPNCLITGFSNRFSNGFNAPKVDCL